MWIRESAASPMVDACLCCPAGHTSAGQPRTVSGSPWYRMWFRYRDGGRSTKYDRIRLRAVRTSLPEEPPAMTLTRSVFRFVESRFRGEIVNSTRVITSRRRVTADQRRSRRLEGLALVPGTTATGQAATGPGLRRSGGVWPLSRSPALSPGGGRNRVRSVG